MVKRTVDDVSKLGKADVRNLKSYLKMEFVFLAKDHWYMGLVHTYTCFFFFLIVFSHPH